MNLTHRFFSSILLVLALNSTLVFADEAALQEILDKAEANLLINIGLAKNLLNHAESLSLDLPQSKQHARLLNLQAHAEILQHHLSDAFAKAEEAEQLALKTNNELQLAEAIRKQGIINFLLDFDADALELLTTSLSIHLKLNSEYVLNNLQSIANVYLDNNATESLIKIGEELVEKAVIRQNRYYEEQGYSFIIAGLVNQGNYAQASVVANQVLKSFGNNGAIIYLDTALVETKLNHYQSALDYIEKQLNETQNNSTPLIHLSANLLKAEVLMLDNQPSLALPLLQAALKEANELNITMYRKEALNKLANYYQNTGDAALALDYFKQYEALKEADASSKQAQQLAFSRARLEVEQKNQHILELELSSQLVKQQNTYQLYFLVFSCLVIVLLIYMYRHTVRQKRALSEYSAALKSASEAKSEFLARMSHEIRTPINAIIGLTKLSLKPAVTPRQQTTNLQQIEESSKTLLGVINDILDFSKIEAGKLDIDETDFELDKVIEQAMRLQSLKAQEKNLELSHYITKDVPLLLHGDALRIQQVLNNLLSNAVKFTKQGAVFVLVNKKYAESGITLEFAVKDSGIGLTEKQRARLFEAFTQADESITRRFGGTGLGLTICKQLVELMGGEIWVESHVGQGSTFYFTINVEEANTDEQKNIFSVTQLAELKVLLVDDVELSRQTTAEALLRFNINSDVARNSALAMEKVRQAVEEDTPYDVLILDWKMPDIDGIELASIVQEEFSPPPQIIMLSAYDQDILQELGRSIGITNYLQKPVDSSSLLNAILSATSKLKRKVKGPSELIVPAPNLSGIEILLVEDNELNRKVAKGFLTDTHADISVAENGQIALQMLREYPVRFGLILMDIQMPVMDGLIATRKIRGELHLQTPIIAMTAQAMAGDVEKSLAVGMNAHVTKPLDPNLLYQVLHNVLLSQDAEPEHLPKTEHSSTEKPDLTNLDVLTVIESEKAMHHLRVDERTYQDLVRDFINLEGKLSEFNEALNQHQVDKLGVILHLFNPALSYIGANNLAKLTVEIELALKQQKGEIPKTSLALIGRFQQATSVLISTLKQHYSHEIK
jgi:two-component system, sensor histidine kinase and response regulator